MTREKLSISSDQMELLLAFEKAGNLETLSEMMAKDSSVISRRLKELANIAPVLIKIGGRWQITSVGLRLNAITRDYIQSIEHVLPSKPNMTNESIVPPGSLLIIINAQKALHFSALSKRSNIRAEENLLKILKFWRKKKWPIAHVKHISDNSNSLFYHQSIGAEFIETLKPQTKEIVIEKYKASAFTKTSLERRIQKLKPPSIVLAGFTAGECIDATAKHAKDLDLVTFVVGDATATFDIIGPNGKLHKAEKVHRSTMANLHANFAQVIETSTLTSS